MSEWPGSMDDPLQAQRLDAAIEALAAGRDPGVDPRTDPELDGLVQTAAVLQSLFAQATDSASFESFRRRSRLAVIHRSETLQTARQLTAHARGAIAPVAGRAAGVKPSGDAGGPPMSEAVPFNLTWWRRRLVPAFAPVAAAAAAAAVTFAALGGGGTGPGPEVASSVIGLHQVGEPAQPAAENLTPRTIDEQLVRLQLSLATIAGAAGRGESVPAALLRQVTEDTASVQRQIDSAPRSVSDATVASYAQAATQGQAVLSGAKAEPGGEGALSAAQLTADQAVVTAARFLAERNAEATATPALLPPATATPIPTATEAAAPTETPAPTATATAGAASAPRADPTIE